MKLSELKAIIRECLNEAHQGTHWKDPKWVKSVNSALAHISRNKWAMDGGIIYVDSRYYEKVESALSDYGVSPMPDINKWED